MPVAFYHSVIHGLGFFICSFSLNRVFIAIHKKARFVVNFSLIMAGSASEALYNASLFTLHSLAKRYSRNKDNNNGAQQFLGNAGQVLPSDY